MFRPAEKVLLALTAHHCLIVMKVRQEDAKTFWLNVTHFFRHSHLVMAMRRRKFALLCPCWRVELLIGQVPWLGLNQRFIRTLDSLQKALVAVFDHNMKAEEAAERLMNINQGRKSVAEFAILFRSIATYTGWLDEPLMVIFNRALSEPVRYALSLVEAPTSLDALVERAIRVDNRIRKQGGDRFANKNGQPSPYSWHWCWVWTHADWRDWCSQTSERKTFFLFFAHTVKRKVIPKLTVGC